MTSTSPDATAGDGRIVYGARCAWWGTIEDAGTLPAAAGSSRSHGLPCCPHCGGVLFEVGTEAEWWAGVDAFDEQEPGYRAFIEWLRGKCYDTLDLARVTYQEENTP